MKLTLKQAVSTIILVLRTLRRVNILIDSNIEAPRPLNFHQLIPIRPPVSTNRITDIGADERLAERCPGAPQFNDRFTSFAGRGGHLYTRLSATLKTMNKDTRGRI